MTTHVHPADMASAASHKSDRIPSRTLCAVVVAIAWVSVRAVGLNRTLRRLNRWSIPGRVGGIASKDPVVLMTTTARRVATVASFFPGRALCLEQSVALFALARLRGLDARFRIGVRPYGFSAHAWVEVNGQPIDEHPETLRDIVPLPEWPL